MIGADGMAGGMPLGWRWDPDGMAPEKVLEKVLLCLQDGLITEMSGSGAGPWTPRHGKETLVWDGMGWGVMGYRHPWGASGGEGDHDRW